MSVACSSTRKAIYPNLSAEIVRSGKKLNEIATFLGIHRNTLDNKLCCKNGAQFNLDEVEKLLSLFPNATYEYLFYRNRKEK